MVIPNTAKISINSDMGESLGLHSFGNDEPLMSIIDLANVACGFHAGDPGAMDKTVALAKEHGVKVGAHPGLPDLVGFGRREMKLRPDEVESLVHYQVGALKSFLDKYDLPLNHIKPHGAMYNMLSRDVELARPVIRIAKMYDVPFYFPSFGEEHRRYAEEQGVTLVQELYVDLNYNAEGELVVERQPGHTNPQAAAERVSRALHNGEVIAIDGTPYTHEFESICVHSDAPNAVEVAQAVRDALAS